MIQEVARGCAIVGDIENDRKVGAAEALRIFESINRKFFSFDTRLRDIRDPGLPLGIAEKPPCTPFFASARNGPVLLRIDNDTVLETRIRPPSPSDIQMTADREGRGFYEIQHHHPVIFGVTPEAVSAAILVVFLLIGFSSSIAAGYILIRRASKEAAQVLDRLKDGDLKARFPDGFVDELSANFNAMADEIEKLVHMQRQAERSRGRLNQELAHDLKTPVASIRGLLEALRDKAEEMSPSEREDFLDTALGETFYFSRLVDDLIFISGVKEPEFKSETRRIDLAALVRSELDLLAKNGEIRSVLDGPESAWVYGEEILVQRLIRNGLDNAASFAVRRIEARIRSSETHWLVEIDDDGPGPSGSEIAQFGLKRSTRSLRTQDDGRISLGMGSVIMRRIAQSYGGDAVLSRADGRLKGARLTLSVRRQ